MFDLCRATKHRELERRSPLCAGRAAFAFGWRASLAGIYRHPALSERGRCPPIKPRRLPSVGLTKRHLAPGACLNVPRLTARACSGTCGSN